VFSGAAVSQPAAMSRSTWKSCLRFLKLWDLPLDVVGYTVAFTPVERRIEVAEAARLAEQDEGGRRPRR